MHSYISPEGLKKLQDTLSRLEEELKNLLVDKKAAYTLSGDTWHDNPYFNKLQQDEDALVKKILGVRSEIDKARVFVPESRNIDRVRIGSIVRFSCVYAESGQGFEEVWEIAGYGETDDDNDKVAYNSPIGSALLGMAPGEVKSGLLPKGTVTFKIIQLYPDWESTKL